MTPEQIRRIILTDHAKERFHERWNNQKDNYHIEACKAFYYGRVPEQNLLQKFISLGFFKSSYWLSTYRIYKGFLFVFQNEGKKYILKTLRELK